MPKDCKKTNLTVLIDKNYYLFLKKITYDLSVKEEKKIGLGELVRRALEKKFPMPKDNR